MKHIHHLIDALGVLAGDAITGANLNAREWE